MKEHHSLALKNTAFGIAINLALAFVKGIAGYLGNSYALIADAIESTSDIFTSMLVYAGLHMARKPADENHPYGHGKFEPLVAAIVALILFGAAILISVKSIYEIATPHHSPAPFTLIVLIVVVTLKEFFFRRTHAIGKQSSSLAVNADAWHHRSDAITSAAAAIGIGIALWGGAGYEAADDYAALIAAGIIAVNAGILLKPALVELIDTAPDPALSGRIRQIALTVPGVFGTHKCHVRKVGFDYYVDLDVLCDPDATIRVGHTIAHNVGDAIHQAMPEITRILVHVEPADDFGRRMKPLSS